VALASIQTICPTFLHANLALPVNTVWADKLQESTAELANIRLLRLTRVFLVRKGIFARSVQPARLQC
jgi:hypothetical protein